MGAKHLHFFQRSKCCPIKNRLALHYARNGYRFNSRLMLFLFLIGHFGLVRGVRFRRKRRSSRHDQDSGYAFPIPLLGLLKAEYKQNATPLTILFT